MRRMNDKTEPSELNIEDYMIHSNGMIDDLFDSWINYWKHKNFMCERSSFTFVGVCDLIMYMTKVESLHGAGKFSIPNWLSRNNKSIWSVDNIDDRCFIYSLVAMKNNLAVRKNKNKVETFYDLIQSSFDDSMLRYPVNPRADEIDKFEEINKCTVNIYGLADYENQDKHILPIRRTKISKFNKYPMYNLLFLMNDGKQHYVAIKSLGGLFNYIYKTNNTSKEIGHFPYVCPYCLYSTQNPDSINTHGKYDCQVKTHAVKRFPEKGSD